MRSENLKRQLQSRQSIDKRAVVRAHLRLIDSEMHARNACEVARSARTHDTKTLCQRHAEILAELKDFSDLMSYLRNRRR